MSRIIDNYSFDSITPYESIIDFPRPTSHIFPETSSNQSIAILPSINEPTPAQIEHTFWRPSDALLKVLRRLHEIDYTQFPCVPCSYCSRLLYPNQIKWITRQTNYIFPFEHVYPHIPLTTHPRNSTKVAVCPSCKLSPSPCPRLTRIPPCIENVPDGKRKYLSPIYLHSSLVMYPLTQNTDQLKVNLDIQKIYEHYHCILVCWVRFSKTSTCLPQKIFGTILP